MDQQLETISLSDSKSNGTSSVFKISDLVHFYDSPVKERNKTQTDDASLAIITLSSETSQPLGPTHFSKRSTKNPSKLRLFNQNYQQSQKTKVSDWLNENYDSLLKHIELPHFSTSQENRCILVRHDYNKNTCFSTNANPTKEQNVDNVDDVCIGNNRLNSQTVEQVETLSTNEMQKKLELYEYLKLMDKKPQSKLNLELAQNRRSSRVKNLVLLNEKRALQKQQQSDDVLSSTETKKDSKGRRSISKELSDSDYSKESKQFGRRSSLSIMSSFFKSSKKNMPKSSNVTDTNSRVNIRTETITISNIESLQVPEITSTNSTLLLTPHTIKRLSTKNIQEPTNKTYTVEDTCKSTAATRKDSVSILQAIKTNTTTSSASVSSRSRRQSTGVTEAKSENTAESLRLQNKPRKRNSSQTRDYIKRKVRKLNKNLKLRRKKKIFAIKPQTSEKKIYFTCPQRLNRLRSSGKLKNLKLRSVLFKSKKRKIKKRLNDNVELQESEPECKRFFTTDLIQPGSMIKPICTDLKLYEADFLFDGLTPEHHLALLETKKFLDIDFPTDSMDEQSVHCLGFNNTEINMSMSSLEKIISVVDYKTEYLLKKTSNIDQYTTEDLEVGELMQRLVVKKFAPKVYNNLDEQNSDEKHSSAGEYVQCTSSYPQSSVSCLNVVPSERETITDILSNLEIPHDSTGVDELLTSCTSHDDDRQETLSVSQIEPIQCECQEMSAVDETTTKSLNDCLSQPTIKHKDSCTKQNWLDKKSLVSHTVSISQEKGEIISTYYLDFNLIVVQKFLVSFWNQTPLGNVLGAQDMWIPKGNTERLILEKGCVRKESSEVVISLLDSVAYLELWTKEHKSDKRERPVADIFVAIYLSLSRGGCIKKVLQLENIHGFASDVQYIVLRNSRNIIVSWNIMHETVSSTLIHCYELSPDYQTVRSIKEVQSVNHYLSSLHHIEDCENIIMGYGDQKVTLWNFENLDCCYVIATIELLDVPSLRTLWVKCDRGFLFTLHELNNGSIQLIAINSNASTWKRLRTYNKPEMEHNRLTGVCIENGLLVACYDTGLSCWNAQTSDLILESQHSSKLFLPFGSHIVIVLKDEIHVRQALEYIISMEDI